MVHAEGGRIRPKVLTQVFGVDRPTDSEQQQTCVKMESAS